MMRGAALTSLSTTDHPQCGYILRRMNSDLRKRGVRISIPSQRMDAFMQKWQTQFLPLGVVG